MPNITDFSSLFRRTIRAGGNTGAVVTIALNRVSAKTLLNLTHVTVEDKTSSFTKCRLAIDRGGFVHYIDELITVAAAELVVSRSDIPLGEGDAFITELTGTTTGDILVLTCVGWFLEL
jgi:hypothetical protein